MENWKLISDEKPEYRKKVKFKLVENNNTVWESTGWILESDKNDIYSIKMTDGLTYKNSKPSHWKIIS